MDYVLVNMKNYEYVLPDSLKKKDLYSVDELIEIISNLEAELEQTEQELRDYKREVDEYYTPRRVYISEENGEVIPLWNTRLN